jgi:hypothetical protein
MDSNIDENWLVTDLFGLAKIGQFEFENLKKWRNSYKKLDHNTRIYVKTDNKNLAPSDLQNS